MSYIRSTGNPEGLYIYATSHKEHGEVVEIHPGKSDSLLFSNYNTPEDKLSYVLPTDVFEGIFREWEKNGYDETHYKGAHLWQPIGFDRWLLYYEGWVKPIVAWQVTFSYIATNILWRDNVERRQARRKDMKAMNRILRKARQKAK